MDSCSYFETVTSVYDSWERVKRNPNYEQTVGIALFDRMFTIAPDEWGLFPWTKEEFQNKDAKFLAFASRFVHMLDLAVHMLGPDMETVEDQMFDLGKSHKRFGVTPKHFDLMGKALVHILEELLGNQGKGFTPVTKKAWKDVYQFWSTTMIQGAYGL